jgi:hypothetical protein
LLATQLARPKMWPPANHPANHPAFVLHLSLRYCPPLLSSAIVLRYCPPPPSTHQYPQKVRRPRGHSLSPAVVRRGEEKQHMCTVLYITVYPDRQSTYRAHAVSPNHFPHNVYTCIVYPIQAHCNQFHPPPCSVSPSSSPSSSSSPSIALPGPTRPSPCAMRNGGRLKCRGPTRPPRPARPP